MVNLANLLGWKKRQQNLARESESPPTEDEGPTSENEELHDILVETVLESAEKKAEDKNIAAGGVFDLNLNDIPVEPDEIMSAVDLSMSLHMEAAKHGLLFKPDRRNGESVQLPLKFQRVGKL